MVEQACVRPWREDERAHGRVIAVSDNPIARAIETIATAAGREVVVVADEPDALAWLAAQEWHPQDALVLCDHHAPQAGAVLRWALSSAFGYLAMMASRARAQSLLAELAAEASADPIALDKLRMPAGLNIGGKAAGEIALAVVAEIVAHEYSRPGTPLRGGQPVGSSLAG
jgi:xanthine dehydrogenase accessory factor